MYNITKLSAASQTFLQNVRTGSREANKVIALGLARAIAYKLPLPSTPVESLISYFDLTCKPVSETQIAEINEILPLDIPIAKEYTLAVWTIRYRTLFPVSKAYDSVDCPVANFFGFGSAVSQEIVDMINKEPQKVNSYANGFTDVITDLFVSEVQQSTTENN